MAAKKRQRAADPAQALESRRSGVLLFSLETENWVSLRKAADAVSHQILAKAYRALGIAHHIGEFGVHMSAYSREHVLSNSDGAKSVAASLEKRGFEPGKATPQLKHAANIAERRHKRMFPLDAFNDMWRARNEMRGFPVFEPGDRRLEQGFELSQSMSAAQAVDGGLALARASDERVFDERKLLELSIKASGYATPYADIRSEIDRQLLTEELVLHRGTLARPDPSHELDAGAVLTSEPAVAPLASLAAALHIVAPYADKLSGHERDAVLSVIAGESARTAVSPTPSGQPAFLASVSAAAVASGRVLVDLSPLSHAAAGVPSVEALLATRGALASVPAVLLVHHAQELSARTMRELEARCLACDARLVQLFDPGHEPVSFPARQTNESALLAQAQPFERMLHEAPLGGDTLRVHADHDAAADAAASQAVAALAEGRHAVVLTNSEQSAAALNDRIVGGLSEATGEPVKKIRVRKAKPSDSGDIKSSDSYSVGDTVLLKRKTGALRRNELAVVDAINARAGFLTLRVGDGANAKTVKLALFNQAHHIERVEVIDLAVTPGSMLRADADMLSLGVHEGQTLRVESIESESRSLTLSSVAGAEHRVSLAGAPLPMSSALAMTPDQVSDLDMAHARVARPVVLAHLDADVDGEAAAKVLYLAKTMGSQEETHVPAALIERLEKEREHSMDAHPSIEVGAQQLDATSAPPASRLAVHESDIAGLTALRGRLAAIGGAGSGSPAVRVTLTLQDGRKRLHTLRGRRSVEVLKLELGKMLGASPAPTKSAGLDLSASRPTTPERAR